jgi:cysteine desulfuration protein SufE
MILDAPPKPTANFAFLSRQSSFNTQQSPAMPTVTGLSLDRIAANFEALEDWEQRFSYLLDLGKKLPPMDIADQVEPNRVHGCQATVFLKPNIEGSPPRLQFSAWADAPTVCGLIAILLTMYGGKTLDEVKSLDAEGYFRGLGLEEHLSPTRRNGLHAMIQRIRAIAASRISTN